MSCHGVYCPFFIFYFPMMINAYNFIEKYLYFVESFGIILMSTSFALKFILFFILIASYETKKYLAYIIMLGSIIDIIIIIRIIILVHIYCMRKYKNHRLHPYGIIISSHNIFRSLHISMSLHSHSIIIIIYYCLSHCIGILEALHNIVS